MTYSNMIMARGLEGFASLAAEAGAAGVIVPDLPLEEQGGIGSALGAHGLALIPLVAPTTPARSAALGFALGLGGSSISSRQWASPGNEPSCRPSWLSSPRRRRTRPTSRWRSGSESPPPRGRSSVGKVADGVIIGTRLVREVADAPDREAAVAGVSAFLHETHAALSR